MARVEARQDMGFVESKRHAPCKIIEGQSALEDDAIQRAEQGLLWLQGGDGFWCFDQESDPGLTADYVLIRYFPLWALARYRNLRNTDRARHKPA